MSDRRSWFRKITLLLAGLGLAEVASSADAATSDTIKKQIMNTPGLKLGAFSVSLNVKDLKASKDFYEILGFNVFGGDISKNYLIMKNENAIIGLFHGMFQNNILTFNPGWDENAKKLDSFDDVRKLQQQLKKSGIRFEAEADEASSGPASFVITDPDGNTIYVDQHV